MTLTSTELEELVKAETEQLLERCVQAGADYEEAFWTLNMQIVLRGLDASAKREAKKEAPFVALLEKAYNCQQAGDQAGHRDACLAWLKAKHGVEIGDVVDVYGWAQPREILIDDFIINWSPDSSLMNGFMWLTGPTSHAPKGKPPASQGQHMEYAVRKVRPSEKLKRLFPERF